MSYSLFKPETTFAETTWMQNCHLYSLIGSATSILSRNKSILALFRQESPSSLANDRKSTNTLGQLQLHSPQGNASDYYCTDEHEHLIHTTTYHKQKLNDVTENCLAPLAHLIVVLYGAERGKMSILLP